MIYKIQMMRQMDIHNRVQVCCLFFRFTQGLHALMVVLRPSQLLQSTQHSSHTQKCVPKSTLFLQWGHIVSQDPDFRNVVFR